MAPGSTLSSRWLAAHAEIARSWGEIPQCFRGSTRASSKEGAFAGHDLPRLSSHTQTMAAGDQLTVIATDPGAMKDFHHFCEASGDTLQSATEADGVLTFVISKVV